MLPGCPSTPRPPYSWSSCCCNPPPPRLDFRCAGCTWLTIVFYLLFGSLTQAKSSSPFASNILIFSGYLPYFSRTETLEDVWHFPSPLVGDSNSCRLTLCFRLDPCSLPFLLQGRPSLFLYNIHELSSFLNLTHFHIL